MAQDAAAVAGQLGSAGAPWLAIEMSGPGGLALSAGDALVIDIADARAAPVAVNPFEPAAGYPIQAHADRLAGLFEAAFGLAEPVVTALKAGLARTYADCGWDVRTGTASPGAVTSPAVPAFRQLRAAVMAAAADLGYGPGMQAAVRGFVATRLDALWAGPTGRFLEGGHPADVRSLLTGNVLVANSGVADDQAVSFLAGVLLVRIAEELRDREAGRCTVIVGTVGALSERLAQTPNHPAAAGWFGVCASRSLRAPTVPTMTVQRPASRSRSSSAILTSSTPARKDTAWSSATPLLATSTFPVSRLRTSAGWPPSRNRPVGPAHRASSRVATKPRTAACMPGP